MTLVLAGLSDTEQKASAIGLTRAKKTHRIGCFDKGETSDAMIGFCKVFNVDVGDNKNMLLELADATDGWPRHIYSVQSALSDAELEVGINGKLDRIIGWKQINDQILELRESHYRSQCSDQMEICSVFAGRVMERLGQADKPERVVAKIDEILTAAPELKLPRGMDSRQFHYHLVHQGALETDNRGIVRCLIPSFRRFLIEEGKSSDIPLQQKVVAK